jgi:hypothetical protein
MLDIGLGLVGLVLIKKLLSSKSPAPLPPGPKGYPLLGNMLDMPSSEEWLTFTQWGEKYGEQGIIITTLIHLMIYLRSDQFCDHLRPDYCYREFGECCDRHAGQEVVELL